MKSCAKGLIVRPFSVMMPTGLGTTGNLTGRTLTEGSFAPNRTTEAGHMAM